MGTTETANVSAGRTLYGQAAEPLAPILVFGWQLLQTLGDLVCRAPTPGALIVCSLCLGEAVGGGGLSVGGVFALATIQCS